MVKKIAGQLNFFLKYRELFFQLIIRDIKLKYRRSVLGYLWSVLNPLLTMIVMFTVFSQMFRFNVDNFAVYLLIGNMLFSFMQNAVNRAMLSIIGSAPLLKKTYIPKYIFTVSSVTSELVNLFFSLIALVLVIVITGSPVTWRIVLVLIPIVEVYLFCIGLGMLLAQAAVFFRDTQYLWSVFSTMWMYLTPIFYPIDLLPQTIQTAVRYYNPMYVYIDMFRNFAMWGNAEVMNMALQGFIIAALVFLLGMWTFTITKRKFILYI